ncbi:integrase/recombinase, partial [mine drainage metagenome]
MAPLMEDPDVARWHSNLARGSLVTADVYVRRLGAFLEQTGQTQATLLTIAEKALRDVFLDFITEEERKGRAGAYIASSIKAVKSWLAHGGRTLTPPPEDQG